MDDFGMLARDFGFRPHGKSAPMKSSVESETGDRRNRESRVYDVDHNSNRNGLLFNDVFGGPPKYSNNSIGNSKPSSMSDFDYDSIFKNSATTNDGKSKSASSSTLPVYDKPVYDEDIFDGLPGLKSKSMSSSAMFEENVFASMASPRKYHRNDHFDHLLGNLGPTEKAEPKNNNYNNSKSSRDLDDMLPAFGSGTPAGSNRLSPESSRSSKSTSNLNQTDSTVMDDPFVVLESTSTPGVSSPSMFTDPLEEISMLSKPRSMKADHSFASGGAFDDIDPLNGFGRPAFSSDMNNRGNGSPLRSGSGLGGTQASADGDHTGKSSFRYSGDHLEKKVHVDNFQESHQNMFDVPTRLMESQKLFGQTAFSPLYANDSLNQTSSQVEMSSNAEEQMQASDDIWLTVSEIPLFTQLTNAPPPSRPPPPIPCFEGSFASNARKKADEFSSPSSYTQHSKSPRPAHAAAKGPSVSSVDELENFAMGRSRKNVDENADFNFIEENSAAAAAMKEAMDRAEAKFRQAKELREREYAKASRNKDAGLQEKDDIETQERECRENQERLDRERWQREENEREQRRLEKERERERERARQAVERATREARERASAEARERAAREKVQAAEKAAVEKALSEARERAERAAVLRAQAEARERAAAEARERAEKAAQEKANLEAKEKEDWEKAAWEKAAVERAATEARRRAERAAVDRAAAEARERAAAAAKMNQKKNETDLESFFSMGSRPSSAPRPSASSSDPPLDPQSQGRGGNEGQKRTSSSGTSSNIRKASSTTNIVDDLTSLFGAAASSREFQEVGGETEERRNARLERHQRTQERAAKALAEKNQRDLQTQREQEERHRIAETLDIEIKRWAAGKEGNLRALLSTLQYVLWPECGWQPVSLTDLIMGASVKKVYRKATLCIHPDKVQQKGATLQQKYIAEKVFDLLKEAWNKFNSEELF